jgi:hypothetical protein
MRARAYAERSYPDILTCAIFSWLAFEEKEALLRAGGHPHRKESLAEYLPDLMRFCAFSGACVRNGPKGRNLQ